MTYMINARLERGTPSLTLIDARTGEERLHWCGEGGWKSLFKRLVLISCADQLSLIQRVKSPVFGDECIECSTCMNQNTSTAMQTHILSTETKNIVSLISKLQR